MKMNCIRVTKRSKSTPVHHGFGRECGKRSVLKRVASYTQHSFHPVAGIRILAVARYAPFDRQKLLLVRGVRVFEVEKQGILQANASHATKRGAVERRALPSIAAAAALGERMVARWESETAK